MFVSPMLLHKFTPPFNDLPWEEDRYISELKLDGFRLLLSKFDGKVNLYTRHNNNVTSNYILNFIWANYKYISIPWLILNLAHLICAK